ncbi:MAG: hypothetical protein GXP19_04405 [Gammaproteobacteria bacterium]|nr:hypothetical protein [Gammaproteobacteria bacterium]
MSIDSQLKSGGIAVWSIRHPIGVVMIVLAVVVLGAFSLNSLGINLLPHLIYPEVRVRINDPGVPAQIMEDRVTRQLEEQLPQDIKIQSVGDQAVFVRHALKNATSAALTDALLAMIVVYIFLGDIRRTLIIGSAIPIAIMVTFVLMALGGLSLNIMTLGGLALGVGMLVDNTIVMLENIYRHQREGESFIDAPVNAAREVNSAIVASTSTNLAAVLPFLFVGGLVGLLFKELIFTISAAIVASLVIALTLVPALSARVGSIETRPFRGSLLFRTFLFRNEIRSTR